MTGSAAPTPRRSWLASLEGVHDFATLRSRLLDNVILLLAIAATPGVGLSVLRAREIGWQPFMTAQLIVLALVWGLYATLPRLTFPVRVTAMAGLLFVAAVVGTVQLGPAADARFFLVFITLLVGLLVGVRGAVISVGINLLAIGVLGVIAVTVGLPLVIDYPMYVRRASTWWSIAYTLSVYGGVIAYVAASLLQHLNASADALRRQKQLGEAILRAQSAFIRADDTRQAFAGLLDDLRQLTSSPLGFIGEVLPDAEGKPYLKTYAITDVAWDDASRAQLAASAREGMVFRNLDTLFGAAIRSGEVLISNDPGNDPRRAGLPAGHPPLTAFMAIPVCTQGRVVALLGLANRPAGYDQALLAELQPLLATLRQLFDALHARRIKDEFVSVVSHELRTPLTSMTGALGLMSSGALGSFSKEAQGLLAIAQNNGARLARLVDDLLDMGKLASGQLRMTPMRQPLRPLLEQVIEANRGYGVKRGVQLQLELAGPEVDVEVDGDRLQQVLSNLLSNAIKFSPDQGRVTVTMAQAEDRVRVEVSDQGPGVPEAFAAKVFDKFSQADSSDTRAAGGTGLGLAIARELVERMGGSIGFSSELGRGACFHIELPSIALR